MAQKTKAQILAEIASLLADNTTGDISASDVRTVVNDITDSYEDLIATGTTSQYLRGDKTWQTLPILEASGTLSAAQINALDTSPLQIIPAPGANKFIIIESAVFHYKAGTTGFTITGGNEVVLVYGTSGTGSNFTVPNTVLSSTTSYIYYNLPPLPTLSNYINPGQFATNIINDNITIKLGAGSISGGDGTINFTLQYRIITTN
jgi:hypothetical protein